MSHSLYLSDLTWPEVDDLRRSNRPAVLLWPLGATEPHGPHAPLATDSIISAIACERAAARLADAPDLDVLILPTLPLGVTAYGAAFPGVISLESSTLRGVIVDTCRSLARHGLHRIVLVNSHFEPEHMATLRQAVDDMWDEGVTAVLLDLLRRRNVERLTSEFRSGEAHAGRYETSIVLAGRPDLVDVDLMRALPHVEVDMTRAIADGKHSFVAMGMDQAYCGAPAEATAEEGEQTLSTLADMVIELARTTLNSHDHVPDHEGKGASYDHYDS